jgi:High potential iron-sulfur protein
MGNEKLSRRALLNQAIAAVALIPGFALTRQAIGAAATPLDPADPMAKALAYAEASAKPDQNCANCAQYQGKSGDSRAGCSIFAGKTVAAAGWCSVWAKKAG